MRESKIEQAICKYAKSLGWLQYKFVSPNVRGVPDRIFMRKGLCMFIEFKTTGMNLTKLQKRRAKEIKRAGFHVFHIDSVQSGKGFFNQFEEL